MEDFPPSDAGDREGIGANVEVPRRQGLPRDSTLAFAKESTLKSRYRAVEDFPQFDAGDCGDLQRWVGTLKFGSCLRAQVTNALRT